MTCAGDIEVPIAQELAAASLVYPTVVKQEREEAIDAPEAKVHEEEVAPERLPAECRAAIVQNMIVHPGAVCTLNSLL